MAIELKCTECGRTLRVGDEHAGKRASCPQCNTIMNVPTESQVSDAENFEESLWRMKTPEGQTYGPVNQTELNRWLSEGRITADCWLQDTQWKEADWRSADQVYPVLRTQPVRSEPSVTQASNPFASPVSNSFSDRAGANTYQIPHRGGLILALALCSWLICWPFPIFGFAAWMMGSHDLREMRRGRMDPSGMGITQAGQILGMIHALLFIMGFVVLLFLMLAGIALGS